MKLVARIPYFIAGILGFTTAANVLAAENSESDAPPEPLKITIMKYFDEARNRLSPATGSSTYNFDREAVDNLPEGYFSPVNDVLLRAPGVAQDSYGQLHVRGDHADIQYRINGIIIPEGISGFGQALDTRFADKIDFMTGALPAQYGYRTAGIVDITTKSGVLENGGRSSVMGGGNATREANQEFFGSQGNLNYYFTGTYDQNNRGVEPPTASSHAIHDFTKQDKEFGYMSYILNPENRVSVLFGNSTNRFQIPNNPGQQQQFMLNGTPDYPSDTLNENQFERNTYGIVALQGILGDRTDYQLALFTRYSDVLFKPDPLGDLIFNGIASRDYRTSVTTGVQNDYSYRFNDANTIRSGLSFSYENARSDTNSSVFSTLGPDCTLNPCTPVSIIDNHSKNATLAGVYLQDEWKALNKLTVNYGARFDVYQAFVSESQLSPRIGAVYALTPQTKLHAGYARYFTPPPTELIAPVTIAAFQNTTGAPPGTVSSPVKPERDNYFDAGVIQTIDNHLTLGIDAYYKQARNLLDEGQFGSALIFSPFNYEKGYAEGVEFTGDYHDGAFSGYANLALSRAMGKNVTSGQFNFDPATELPFIATHYVHLDHDQTYTGSAGTAYKFHDIQYSADMLYGSGLRNGDNNTSHLPFYTQVNAAAGKAFNLGAAGLVEGRLSIINVFDRIYEIRDGSGIGVFAPQYGPRRTFLLSLSKPF